MDALSSHCEYTCARLRLVEAKSETSEKQAKSEEIWAIF